MKKEAPKRSSLFLMELIISILFFALASAVCIQIFTKAHLQSNQTADLNMAITKASSIAEYIQSTDDPLNVLQEQFPTSISNQQSLKIYYNKSWNPCNITNASYMVSIQIDTKQQMRIGTILVHQTNSTSPLYQLTVKHHLPYTLS